MNKEGKLNRRNGVLIALISALSIITVALIKSCENDNTDEKPKEIIFDGNNADENNANINKQEIQTNHGTVIGTQNNTTIINSNTEKEGYSVKGSIIFLSKLKNSKKIKINQDSSKEIRIGFTGELIELKEESGIYIYNGGYLSIYINNDLCKIYTNFPLEYIKSNNKQNIELELRRRIDNYINSSYHNIEKELIKCL